MESLEHERPVGEHLLTQFHRAVTSLVRKTCDLDDAYRANGRARCSRKLPRRWSFADPLLSRLSAVFCQASGVRQR